MQEQKKQVLIESIAGHRLLCGTWAEAWVLLRSLWSGQIFSGNGRAEFSSVQVRLSDDPDFGIIATATEVLA